MLSKVRPVEQSVGINTLRALDKPGKEVNLNYLEEERDIRRPIPS